MHKSTVHMYEHVANHQLTMYGNFSAIPKRLEQRVLGRVSCRQLLATHALVGVSDRRHLTTQPVAALALPAAYPLAMHRYSNTAHVCACVNDLASTFLSKSWSACALVYERHPVSNSSLCMLTIRRQTPLRHELQPRAVFATPETCTKRRVNKSTVKRSTNLFPIVQHHLARSRPIPTKSFASAAQNCSLGLELHTVKQGRTIDGTHSVFENQYIILIHARIKAFAIPQRAHM